jgi:hypothetical protein
MESVARVVACVEVSDACVECVEGVEGERSVTPVMPPWLRTEERVAFEDFFGSDVSVRMKTEAGMGDGETKRDGLRQGVASAAARAGHGSQMGPLAEKLGLGEEEQTLAFALAAGLDEGLERVCEAIVISRVTREDVQQHAVEVGCPKQLTAQVKTGLARFAVFVQTLEVLGVVRFEGRLEGRSLLVLLLCVLSACFVWYACCCLFYWLYNV